MEAGILTLDDLDFRGKTVILRLDINTPVDSTGQLADDNRLRKSLPTIRELAEGGARTVMLAHQGDVEDYKGLVSLAPHAQRLSELLGKPVEFLDDIAGPAAVARIQTLQDGDLLLLTNVRYLCEEVSTFVNYVKLTPTELARTWLVRNLAPLADYYVNEAFAAAHRYTPSLVGFAEVLPSAGGRLLVQELSALTRVKENPGSPCVFLLGGSRSADAFAMMEFVLKNGTADAILTSGLTGEIMLLAAGHRLGDTTEQLIGDKGLWPFVQQSEQLLSHYGDRIHYPVDVAYVDNGQRVEVGVGELPQDALLIDIGQQTIERYAAIVATAETIFFNGPAGVYEKAPSAKGTEQLLQAIVSAPGYSVIGGGDSVAAARRFGVADKMGYVCTAGGGMVRFMSGRVLPVVEALTRAAERSGARAS